MKRYGPYLILAVVVWALYGNTLNHSFHYDDVTSILQKPWVRGLEHIGDFITNLRIRPVVILSFNLNYAVSGFDVWSYHVFNITAHVLVVWLVYGFARMMATVLIQTRGAAGLSPRRVAWLAALVFAVHPLNTQAVTYIASRSSVLATLFYLAVLMLFFKGFRARQEGAASWKYYAGAALCLLLGALSKEIVISLPAMLFLCHFYFYSGQTFRQWIARTYVPILLVALPLAVFIVWRVFSEGGVLPTGPTYLSGATYFLTETFVIPFEYFKKMLWPVNQSIDVHFPIVSDWSRPANWLGLGALALYGVAVCVVSRRSRLAGFGLAWMLVTILPTSSFVPLHDVAVEHRMYLPLVGFALAFGATADAILRWCAERAGKTATSSPRAAQALIACVLVLLAGLTVHRNAVWKDEVTLWSDAKKKAPRLVRPYNNLGEAYDRRREYDRALAEFKAALEIDPNYVFALNNLGNVYGKLNRFEEAIASFKKVLALKKDYAPAHYNLARALQAVRRPGEALAHYHKAVTLNPDFEQAVYNYALICMQTGRLDESVRYFERYIALQPEQVQGYFGLGNAWMLKGDYPRALDVFRKTVTVAPTYLPGYVNLAVAQMQSGDIDGAIDTYEEILKRSPGVAGVHKNLGLIYTRFKPDPSRAIHHFEEALRLDPNQPEAPALKAILAELRGQASGAAPSSLPE